MHRQEYRPVVRHKVWLDTHGRFVLGDGGAGLLRAIGVDGSIRAGARRVGWSYRHALAYLDNAEAALGYPLIERTRGGSERGGARLSVSGREFLRRYVRFRKDVDAVVLRLFRRHFASPRRAR